MAEPFSPFSHQLRVRFAECDPQGVVFNSHYLAYVDVAITELWRAALGNYQTMLDRGVDVVVAEARLRFRSPARFDDEVRLEVTVTHMGNTSIISQHRICRGDDVLVEVEIRHVTVDRATLAKLPIPDWLRDGLSPWHAAPDAAAQDAPAPDAAAADATASG
jgi:acyl-CoA thioester hydrolase